jgi:hypothetical protein
MTLSMNFLTFRARSLIVILALGSASAAMGNGWFSGPQGFEYSGGGTEDVMHIDIRNTWGNSVILDPFQRLNNDLKWENSSLWGMATGASIKSIQHGGADLNFNFGLFFSFSNSGFGLGLSDSYISPSVLVSDPFQIQFCDTKCGFDDISGYTYQACLEYILEVAPDGSGKGSGFVQLTRTKVPDLGTSAFLVAAGLAGLAAVGTSRRRPTRLLS